MTLLERLAQLEARNRAHAARARYWRRKFRDTPPRKWDCRCRQCRGGPWSQSMLNEHHDIVQRILDIPVR